VATNLRLRREVADAVRAAALESGRSQQEIIREAIDRYLALAPTSKQESDLGALIVAGTVRPPRSPHRKAGRRLRLPAGVTSADLLDRDDRF
jgi:Ribbon-helix-helix protein, copG family